MRIGTRIALGFAVSLLPLGSAAAVAYRTNSDLVRSSEWVDHTYRVLRGLDDILLTIAEVEAAVRGFVVSGDEVWLAPYRDRARALRAFEALSKQTRDPRQQLLLVELEPLIVARLAALDEVVEARRSSGLETASAIITSGAGPRLTERIQAVARHFQEKEIALLEQRDEEQHRAAGRSSRTLSVGMLVASLGSGLIVFGLARSITIPVSRLVQGAHRLGEGELDLRLETGTVDELSALARAFNGMAARRQTAEGVLRAAKESADAANKELDAFAYSVSHDLRAPLRGIDGFSQALLDDCAPSLDETGRKHLARIRSAAQRMAELIDDLLGLSRVTRTEIRHERVDLTALGASVFSDLQKREPERIATLSSPAGLEASGDLRLLRVVLENLLGNAWKFSSKKNEVRVELGVDAVKGAFFVRDHGAGFDMKYATKLFGAFQRLHSASEFEGSGIGLATTQRILNRHGGRIWAESIEGEGTTFWFSLPGYALNGGS